jgi:YHS domain-containing protein/putative intracellular protease/amidase
MAALPFSLSAWACGEAAPSTRSAEGGTPEVALNPLQRPADGSAIPVAFLISDDAVVIDFGGPWEVFSNVMPGGRMDMNTFRLYTVAETTAPITASGGMKIIPDYTLKTSPLPKVIVIPAQKDPSAAVLEWIRSASKTADVTMSVCTGAFLLAQTGLLTGKAATTHHAAYVELAMKFPEVRVKRGVRFVEDGNLATSGGLACGIDLALHVVARYYGREVATQTAYNMEYQGQGWMNPDANAVYAAARTADSAHPTCPVCAMDVDLATAPKSVHKGKTYYFCSSGHKQLFDSAPDRVLAAS